jgi:RNA polymerase sigma-70 factor
MELVDSAAIQAAYDQGRRAWPSVRLSREDFARWAAERVRDGVAVDGEGLYLACACARRDPQALAEFDRRYLREAPYLARFGDRRGFVDDVLQDLRERLFVVDPPRIVDYSGQGSLEGWVRVAAIRLAIDRTRHARILPEDDLQHEPLLDAPDPELAALKGEHREAFAAALSETLRTLDGDDRSLLRFYLADKLTLAEIAALFKVNRTTIVRRLVDCRRRILDETRRRLLAALELSHDEADSLMRQLRSQLDLSIHRLLESER